MQVFYPFVKRPVSTLIKVQELITGLAQFDCKIRPRIFVGIEQCNRYKSSCVRRLVFDSTVMWLSSTVES
jgi:hypothetical protein